MESLVRIKRRTVTGKALVHIIRMHALDPPIVQFLFHLTAHEVQPGLVEKGKHLVWAAKPDQHGSGVSHIAEPLFALPQGHLGAPSLPRGKVSPDDYCQQDYQSADTQRQPALPLYGLQRIICGPSVDKAVVRVLSHNKGHAAVAEHTPDFVTDLVGCSGCLKGRSDCELSCEIWKDLGA